LSLSPTQVPCGFPPRFSGPFYFFPAILVSLVMKEKVREMWRISSWDVFPCSPPPYLSTRDVIMEMTFTFTDMLVFFFHSSMAFFDDGEP